MWQWLRNKFGGSVQPVGTIAAPTAIHYEKTAEEKYKEEHGFSMASTPMPWSDDISAHNAGIEKAYQEAVEELKLQFLAGEYRPRFLASFTNELQAWLVTNPGKTFADAPPEMQVDCIAWDLEMTADRGARADVTKDVGVEMLPEPTLEDIQVARESGHLSRLIAATKEGRKMTYREAFGLSREEILAQARGDQAVADQVEDMARKTFGVESLDEFVNDEAIAAAQQ